MSDDLYKVLDFILNRATDGEVEVILNAVKKRYKTAEGAGAMGTRIGSVARETAKQVQNQFGFSMEGIHGQVKDMVVRILRQHAPELSDKDIDTLLEAWVPEPGSKSRGMAKDIGGVSESPPGSKQPLKPEIRREPEQPAGPFPGLESSSQDLPGEVLLDMVRQFLEYSTGVMPREEHASLRKAIPGWEEKYWVSFPPEVRRLVSLYLKGTINLESCWKDIKSILLG